MPDRIIHTDCQVSGCSGKHYVKNYCHKHYEQIKKHGKIMPDRIKYTICQVPGCLGKHFGKGYCSKHYDQVRKHGKIIPDRIKYTTCKVPGCTGKHEGKGYCIKHYQQIKKHGNILPDKIKYTGCKVSGCNGKHYCLKYCVRHYAQIRSHGEIMPDKIKYTSCQVPGCTGNSHLKGYCKKHYKQIVRHGMLKLENERNRKNIIIIKGNQAEIIIWNKFREKQIKAIIDSEDVEKIKDYYWFFSAWGVMSAKGGAKSLARFIMSASKNKHLLHKNKNPLDNRKSNLICCCLHYPVSHADVFAVVAAKKN
jgi:hypothetical protein